jgi:hypothetical protein
MSTCGLGLHVSFNIMQIIVSSYMTVSATYYAMIKYRYDVWGNTYNPAHTDLAHTVWVFYMSKIYEFVDTVRLMLCGESRRPHRCSKHLRFSSRVCRCAAPDATAHPRRKSAMFGKRM